MNGIVSVFKAPAHGKPISRFGETGFSIRWTFRPANGDSGRCRFVAAIPGYSWLSPASPGFSERFLAVSALDLYL
jgi:hypothetical protein